jgi:pyruvate/2-oxoglutarate dehydrogenase complex dihydrolipoamide acyltransferase (E2) component
MRLRTLAGTTVVPVAVLLAVLGTTAAGATPADGGAARTAAAPAATCTVQSILDGDHFSDVQIAQTAKNNGFTGNGLVISVAVALAESSGWTRAVLIDSDCSRDRGLWQINSYWHSEVSDAQAFDPNGAAQAAFQISAGGTNWTPWVTYTNGAYQQYMARAQAAVNQIGGGGGGTGCGGLPAWNSGSVYTGGMAVSYNGHRWTAKWWTQGDVPGANAQDVWTDNGPC